MHKILIIEDDALVREMLVKGLRQHDFELIEAENGRAGVRFARVYLPDLILSDIKMEGFDGFAALAAIRYQPITSTIPVVLMTGHPDEQGRRFAMEMGADDYLAKPFTLDSLVATIHVQLKKQEAIKQRALNSKQAPPALGRDSTSQDAEAGNRDVPTPPWIPPASEPENRWPANRAVTEQFAVSYAFPAEADPDTLPSKERVQHAATVVETYLQVMHRFHPNLGNTAVRAVAVSRTLAQLLELSAEDSRNLCWAAALHDISFVALDREAVGRWLRDPRKVTEEEDAFIKRHPMESQQMLEDVPVFKTAGHIIRSHHENWDGTGYPDGLVREKIPELSRLLSAVVYYCGQHTLDAQAIRAVRSQSGRMFDPMVVEALKEAAPGVVMPRGIREILLNDMKPGQVVAKDVYNATGMVLLHSGRELTETLINRVKAINRVTPLDQYLLVFC